MEVFLLMIITALSLFCWDLAWIDARIPDAREAERRALWTQERALVLLRAQAQIRR